MPLMESYAPGMFCWAELGSPDAAAAKQFYTTLFGWSAEDRPMGPDVYYTMLTLDGRGVAALYQLEPGATSAPHWLSYIAVESASRSAERARAIGGEVLVEPFDVLDVGRMALVQDPTGAVVALWEARRPHGAGVVREPNAIGWNQLATTDPARAGAFYTQLLDWAQDDAGSGSTRFTSAGVPRGGISGIAPSWGPVPPAWLVYFEVIDCDGQAALAQSLGGSVRVAPGEVDGMGRVAVLVDPQGAVFAVIQPPATLAGAG
jgi:uncharacterized protein